MNIDVVALLTNNPSLLGFFVVGLGYLLGNIQIAGIKAGPVIGVLCNPCRSTEAGQQVKQEWMIYFFRGP